MLYSLTGLSNSTSSWTDRALVFRAGRRRGRTRAGWQCAAPIAFPDIGGVFAIPAGLSRAAILYLRWYNRNDSDTDGALAIDNVTMRPPVWTRCDPEAIRAQPYGHTSGRSP